MASGVRNDDIMDFDFEESRDLTEHSHQDIELVYILEGSLTMMVGRSRFEMKKDDVIVISPDKPHSYHASKDVLVGILHMNYYKLLKYIDIDNSYFRCNSVIDKNKGYQEMQKILNKIFYLYFDKSREGIYLNSLYFELLHIMTTNFLYKKELTDQAGTPDDEKRLQEIEKYVHLNYQYPISLNDLAEQLYLSTSYLSKYIKKRLGMNFVSYLNHIRLNSAVEDMKQSQKSMTRVAMDNGFPNTTAFVTAFKNEYGMIPSIWQKDYLEKQSAEKEAAMFGQKVKEERIYKYLEKKVYPQFQINTEKKEELITDARKYELYEKSWNRMINIGSVLDLLRSDFQEHLLVLKEELGFRYVRFWDIFANGMLVDLKKGKFNFRRIDSAIDFLVKNGMHPFLEMGLKPINLLRTTDNTVVIQEREIPFHSVAEYGEALRSLMVHCVNRYGIKEVEQWYFEQWGDPRITQGDSYGKYFEIFEMAYYTLKSISLNIRVGGAGFGRLYSTLDFQQIINLWKKRMCYPDFISMYGYPYMARSTQEAQNNDRIQDPNFINNQVMMMKEVLDNASMYIKELMLTEWSSSVSDWNSLNDSMYKGAFILKTIIDNAGVVDLMGYWLASDTLTEYYNTGMLLRGGNGLLSTDGIKKPAFYAMKFAGNMYNRLLGRNEYAMVTADDRENYSIVCHNYVSPNFKYYIKKEDEVEVRKQFLLFDDAEAIKLSFRIRHVRNGKYLVKIHSLNEDYGSVQDEWGAMNYSENLSQNDIQYLRDISTPKIRIMEENVENDVLEVETVLKPQEIQSIHLVYQLE